MPRLAAPMLAEDSTDAAADEVPARRRPLARRGGRRSLCLGRPVLWASGPGPSDTGRHVNAARQTRLMLPMMKETLLAVLQEWGLLLAGMDAGRTPLGCPTEFTWRAAVASSCARDEDNARLPLHSRPPDARAHPTVVGTRRRLQLGRHLREAVSGATAGA